MLSSFYGDCGLRLEWLCSDEAVVSHNLTHLQKVASEYCKQFNAFCKLFTIKRYHLTDEKEYYFVVSLRQIPEDLSVKQLYVRNNRSTVLFYTDYYIIKLSRDADILTLLNYAHSYCKTADFLKNIFKEFNTPLPKVICGDEITGLKEYNAGRINLNLPPEARATYEKALIKYFKQERTKSKYAQKWRAFSRTDKFDRKASTLKMFWDFYHRNSSIVSLNLLMENNDHLFTTTINEHEYKRFKKEIKLLDPNILYSISKIEVENGGFIKMNKNKPIRKFKNGPFGRLVTYEAYCEAMEKKFVSEGYDALMDLNPAYYETRQLTYRAIDEPFVAQVLNRIRFAYAKSASLNKVQLPGTDLVCFIDMPTDNMMNFVSLAIANNVPYHIDFIGRFSCPNFEKLCIAYNPMDHNMMRGILDRMVTEKYEFDKIETSLTNNKGVKRVHRRSIQN